MDPAKPDAPWGKAVVRRNGSDLTIVSYSKMLLESLVAAEQLAAHGVSAEVIDLRTLNPLDEETIANSVRRTHHAMVVTEAHLTGGFSAELSARIYESCFDYLEEPVARVAGEDIPIPVSPPLERNSVPNAQLITETGLWLVQRKAPAWAQ
jgi:acetoin:2,6-dichlorophenolindophenol oxidoreductase subunit beta